LGRPRDGAIRRRVIDAALECYADRGWSGFTFESVSVNAKVGRPALYRRWSDREELLADAFRESTETLIDPDRGNIRDDLTEVALSFRLLMRGARGRAGTRLYVEREAIPKVFRSVFLETTAPRDLLIVEILRRGQSRGEVRDGVNLKLAARMLIGPLTLDALDDKASEDVHATVANTVDMLLWALRLDRPMSRGGRR
jgi:AcrR family transcriptional regulator